VLAGAPEFRYARLWRSRDKRLNHGVVRIEPGTSRFESASGVTQVVLEGRGSVRLDDGEEITFGPGEMLYVPAGGATWTIDEPLLQTYHVDRLVGPKG
jgi:uncharacterized cupin superfamily protein